MNRFHLSFVLFFSYLPSLSFAEIEFIYAFKEQAHVQSGNDLSTTSVAWSFGAGVSGDGQVTGATLIYAPKSPRPVDLAGEDGEFETEYEPFSSQTALDLECLAGYTLEPGKGGMKGSSTEGGIVRGLGRRGPMIRRGGPRSRGRRTAAAREGSSASC